MLPVGQNDEQTYTPTYAIVNDIREPKIPHRPMTLF